MANDLIFDRIFNAPIEKVWHAWTDPEHLKKWWGPKIFTCPTCIMDLRVGGKYLWAMRWPDGKDIFNTGVFLEIEPMKKLSFTNCFSDPEGNIVPATYYEMPDDIALEMLTSVTFEDLGGRTKITIVHGGLPDSMKSDASRGWNESLDKLAESVK